MGAPELSNLRERRFYLNLRRGNIAPLSKCVGRGPIKTRAKNFAKKNTKKNTKKYTKNFTQGCATRPREKPAAAVP